MLSNYIDKYVRYYICIIYIRVNVHTWGHIGRAQSWKLPKTSYGRNIYTLHSTCAAPVLTNSIYCTIYTLVYIYSTYTLYTIYLLAIILNSRMVESPSAQNVFQADTKLQSFFYKLSILLMYSLDKMHQRILNIKYYESFEFFDGLKKFK